MDFEINEQGQLVIIPEQYLKSPVRERGVKYAFANKKKFYELVAILQDAGEQKAFMEMGEKIESEGYITKKQVKEIFKSHAPAYMVKNYEYALENRLERRLKNFMDDGGLKRLGE